MNAHWEAGMYACTVYVHELSYHGLVCISSTVWTNKSDEIGHALH